MSTPGSRKARQPRWLNGDILPSLIMLYAKYEKTIPSMIMLYAKYGSSGTLHRDDKVWITKPLTNKTAIASAVVGRPKT